MQPFYFKSTSALKFMDITIRPATPADHEPTIALQTNAFRILCAQDYTPKQIEALVEDEARSRHIDEVLFVAEMDGDMVGFTGLSTSDRQITAVFVCPNLARQGIGKQMLATLEREAMKRGYRVLWVLSSLTAAPFYQAQNYTRIGKAGFWSPSGNCWIPCIKLQKRLLPATFAEKYGIGIVVMLFLLLVTIVFLINMLS